MKTAAEYRAMAEECFKWALEARAKEIPPMLLSCRCVSVLPRIGASAVTSEWPPCGPGWIHEIKDGFARAFLCGPGCASLVAALCHAARLRVVSPEHFPGFGVNEVHLRTDWAIHLHKHATVRSLVLFRHETLHPVTAGGVLEQESWHIGASSIWFLKQQLLTNT
jgi:hypothetical protein